MKKSNYFQRQNLCLALALIFISTVVNAQSALTANGVIEMIKQQANCEWASETVDTFKSGNPDDRVTGIAVAMFANMETLRQAVEKNCNLIIIHEPTFYSHLDETESLKNDPVYQQKREYINKNKLIIWRFHDHWHRIKPDGIYVGMINKLGWKNYQINDSPVFFKLEKQTVSELAAHLGKVLNAPGIRIVGDPKMEVSQVALAVGAPGSKSHIGLLQNNFTEVLIAGEAQEWETYQYVNDASKMEMRKAAIFLGHIPSEEAGMQYCAEWLKGFVKTVPIIYLENGPVWTIK